MDLSIVIVSFNTMDILRDCLKSIYKDTEGIDFEIIVSDNNSTDGTLEMIEIEFPEVILIKNSSNIGFSSANNIGFKITKGRYVLALNPDTIVLNNASVEMIKFMDKHPESGACGCKLLNADKTLQPSWENFPTIFSEIFYGTPLNKIFKHDKRINRGNFYEVDWIMGAFMMIRKEVIEKTGGFDEDYNPAYSEEVDLCYRIKKSGWKIYYYPVPEIIHLRGQITKKRPIWSFLLLHRNKYIFFKKHYGNIYANIYRIARIIICFILTISLFLPGLLNKNKRELFLQKWKLLILFLQPNLKMPDK
ncbi:MAG: glycosyltransferase family 2 protein [Candidatus Firestonebacteria bacterium]|nr:glycosyltransferase family 2 protein [Candidatus Firestonebacteria bacterium]